MKGFINKSYLFKASIFILVMVAMLLLILGMRGYIFIPRLLNIAGLFEIKFYSLAILAAFLFGAYGGYGLLKKYYPTIAPRVDLWEAVLTITIPAVIGARIYHVVTDWYLYLDEPFKIFAVWDGGVGFIGGLGGGLLGVISYCYWRKISLTLALRVILPVLPICQAIGRLGNFFNQELYGLPTDLPWGQFIRQENRPLYLADVSYYHPLFLYESIVNVLLGILLFVLLRRGASTRVMLGLYLLAYGTTRFILDFLRLEGRSGYWYLSYAQWLILGGLMSVVIFGIAFNVWFKLRHGIWFTHHRQLVDVGKRK